MPDTPENLVASAGNNQVVLSWVSKSTTYAIFRGEGSAPETMLDSGLTGNTFTDASVVSGRAYRYRIQTLNGAGKSAPSAEVLATPGGAPARAWSGTVEFGLPGEPIQSCKVSIPDLNRPVASAFLSVEGPNMQAVATKYNAMTFALDGFTPFNFGTAAHPVFLNTASDTGHRVCIIDYRWPERSAQRIQAALTAAAKRVPSHPEIENTSLVMFGFSEGTDNINMAIAQPALLHRVLAVVNLSEIDEDCNNPLATMDSAPHLFVASGLPDKYSSLNIGMEDFPTVTHDVFARGLATNQGAPLTVLNNAGAGHGQNADHPFISVWLDSILSQRLPATVPVSSPVTLPSWQNCASWVGTYDLASTHDAPWGNAGTAGVQMVNGVVSPAFSFTDSRPFTWLPSQKVAAAWLAYANTGNKLAEPSTASAAPPTNRNNALQQRNGFRSNPALPFAVLDPE